MQRSQVSQNQQGIDPRRKESQHKKSRDMSICNFPDLKGEQQAFSKVHEAEMWIELSHVHSDAVCVPSQWHKLLLELMQSTDI